MSGVIPPAVSTESRRCQPLRASTTTTPPRSASWRATATGCQVHAGHPLRQGPAPRLLAHAKANESPRTYALLMLLVATAGRVGSILAASIGCLGYDSGHQVIDLTVEGGATRRFALPAAVNDALDAYLADRGPVGADAPLFATTATWPLDRSTSSGWW
jgi:hypothetical protein